MILKKMILKKMVGATAIAGALGFSAIGLAAVANAAPAPHGIPAWCRRHSWMTGTAPAPVGVALAPVGVPRLLPVSLAYVFESHRTARHPSLHGLIRAMRGSPGCRHA